MAALRPGFDYERDEDGTPLLHKNKFGRTCARIVPVDDAAKLKAACEQATSATAAFAEIDKAPTEAAVSKDRLCGLGEAGFK